MPTKENTVTNQETEIKTAVEKISKTTKKKQKEAVYFEKEFVDNALTIFNVKPECVAAALREKNVVKCTKAEAKAIVSAFMKKEVK